MANRYRVTPEKSEQFTSILLMDYLVNHQGDLPVLMDGNYRTLEPLVVKLAAAGYVKTPEALERGRSYIATDKGRDALAKFMQRYSEYLKVFDVFCAVDLNAGTFAFAKFFDFDTDAAWDAYLRQENWEDLRIAVAEYKKIDPLEIVFMSFLNENRFDFTSSTWQFDLSSGLIWEQMENICNSALSVEQVNQGDDTVMPDIISQGAELTVSLLQQEEEINRSNPQPAPSSVEPQQTTTITEETYSYPSQYYEPYYEPYYISPLWLGLLFLL
jgi:DNA-binding PadR family transcriptional regulator